MGWHRQLQLTKTALSLHWFEKSCKGPATQYETISDKSLEPGQTTMKRMRNTRKRTEALIEEAVASSVASQKWGKEMADAWHAANRELLEV